MAYDASQSQEDDDQNQPGQGAAQGQSAQLSGGGGGFAGGQADASSGSAGGASQTPSQSGTWTNLNSYLDANKDQAAGIGQSVAGAVGGEIQKAKDGLNSVQSGYQSQQPFQDVNNTTGDQVDQAFANPSQYANAGADTSNPEKYLNNSWGFTPQIGDITQYAGSSGQPSYSDVSNMYGTAAHDLQATQSESGRGMLLQNQYGSGGKQYNQGEQNFDQLLLQQDPNNQVTLNNLYSQYAPQVIPSSGASQGGDLTQAQNNAANYYANAQAKAQGFQTQADKDLGNQITGLQGNVAGEVGAAKSAWDPSYQALVNSANAHTLSADQSSQLGLAPGRQLFGDNVGQYISEKANPYAAGGVAANNTAASSGDWQNFQGLQALLSGYNGSDAGGYKDTLGSTLSGTQDLAPKAGLAGSIDQSTYQPAVQNGSAFAANRPGPVQVGGGNLRPNIERNYVDSDRPLQSTDINKRRPQGNAL